MASELVKLVKELSPGYDFDRLAPRREEYTGKIKFLDGEELVEFFTFEEGRKHFFRGAFYASLVGIAINSLSGDPVFQDIGWWMLDGAIVDSAVTAARAAYYYMRQGLYE